MRCHLYSLGGFVCLLFFLLYSKEERTERRAHAGNVMEFARAANQGYNGRRSSSKRSDGRSDRSYADKRKMFSDEFMTGNLKKSERERRKNITGEEGQWPNAQERR